MGNTPTPTTTTLVVPLTKSKIYKYTCISIYNTIHTATVFPICKTPLLMLSKGFLFGTENLIIIIHIMSVIGNKTSVKFQVTIGTSQVFNLFMYRYRRVSIKLKRQHFIN